MSRRAVIAIVAVVLLVVCCGAVACTPLGNAVGVSHSDCDAGDRLEGDSDCKTSKKSTKKSKKRKPRTTKRH